MSLSPDFIQHKFLDGMQGQRFVFSDRVVVELFNLTMRVSKFNE